MKERRRQPKIRSAEQCHLNQLGWEQISEHNEVKSESTLENWLVKYFFVTFDRYNTWAFTDFLDKTELKV